VSFSSLSTPLRLFFSGDDFRLSAKKPPSLAALTNCRKSGLRTISLSASTLVLAFRLEIPAAATSPSVRGRPWTCTAAGDMTPGPPPAPLGVKPRGVMSPSTVELPSLARPRRW